MRKILLATTAIVALSAGSAMASDITISGSMEFAFTDDSGNTASGVTGDQSAYGYQSDVNIKFSNTTDSGLTMTMNMGLHEDGVNDDANASLGGDFGKLYFTNGLDDDLVEAMDVEVAGATSEEGASATAGTITYIGGSPGTGAGASFSYQLPTFVEGLTLAAAHANAAGGADTAAYGANYSMNAGGASVKVAYTSSTATPATGNDTTNTHYGLSVTSGNVTVMAESNTRDDGSTSDFSASGVGAKYTMGAVTIGAYNKSGKDATDATTDASQTAYGLDYTIATGITASVTQTSTDVNSTSSTERLAMSLKMAF